MSLTITHNRVSAQPDDPSRPELIQPSDWNDDHAFSGVLPVANGGSGAATLTGYVIGNGTSAFTASATIPASAITSLPVAGCITLDDETTELAAGTAKITFRMPFAMTVTAVRASLTTASSSGLVTVDINESGASILSTKLTIDQGEKTSTTAATAAVISDSALADDAEITIDIDGAGTGAAGLKVYLIGTRA